LIIVGLCLILAVPAFAQGEGPTDDEVNRIAKGLYCPVCENIPLDVCGTQACIQWRDLIREKLAQGWGEDQIKTYFVDQYGDRVLATPPARGWNWLVYILPPVALLVGAVVLVRALRSWRRVEEVVELGSGSGTSDDPYIERFEQQLRTRHGE
jgi:cytochrome c-type biogenesis protein CcmH